MFITFTLTQITTEMNIINYNNGHSHVLYLGAKAKPGEASQNVKVVPFIYSINKNISIALLKIN